MSDVLRTFVAVLIPSELKAKIAAVQEDLRRAAPDVKWVKPESFHITMEFLGDTDSRLVDDIREALKRVCAEVEPFDVEFAGVGAFPNARRPRVVWAGVKAGTQELAKLAGKVADALLPLGFQKEDKPFRAHITIGRVKDERKVSMLTPALENTETGALGRFQAASIALMQSDLRREGPIYSVLAEVPFGGAEEGAKTDG
jgi:2'-5' RNA ligase